MIPKAARVAAVLSILALGACDDDLVGPCCGDEAEQSFSYQVDASERSAVRLVGVNGEVHVRMATASGTVSIEGVRRVESPHGDAEAYLAMVSVEVTEVDDEIRVRTVQPSNNGQRNITVDYELTLPAGLDLGIVNVNGVVEVLGREADVDIVAVNGTVTLRDIVGNAEVELVNGVIDAEVTPPLGGVVRLATVNGDVLLDVPATISAQLTIALTNGAISVQNLTVHGTISTATTLVGMLGEGEGVVSLMTVNGSVRIRGT